MGAPRRDEMNGITMKMLSYILSVAILFLALMAFAVEKKEKPTVAEPPKKVDQPASAKTIPKNSTPHKNLDSIKKSAPAAGAPKKFDDFVDKNHNGIDDRKENLVKKDEKKPAK
jgi:hypothetical protein